MRVEPPKLIATFGSYAQALSSVNCLVFLPYKRMMEHANTWLPEGKCEKEKEKIEQLKRGFYSDDRPKDDYVFVSEIEHFPCFDTLYMAEDSNLCESIEQFAEELCEIMFHRQFASIVYEVNFWYMMRILLNPLTHLVTSLPALPAPPEKKLLTWPTLFSQERKAYLIEHRHDDPNLQHEYDKQFGLILRK